MNATAHSALAFFSIFSELSEKLNQVLKKRRFIVETFENEKGFLLKYVRLSKGSQ
jgi:histidinol-phosphate/aromatic aminotransferase/cobyric acid decarboxylase-like protein